MAGKTNLSGHNLSIRVTVRRVTKGYHAVACLTRPGHRTSAGTNCSSPYDSTVTVQEKRPTGAVAHALKDLGSRLQKTEIPSRSKYGLLGVSKKRRRR